MAGSRERIIHIDFKVVANRNPLTHIVIMAIINIEAEINKSLVVVVKHMLVVKFT